MKEYYVYYKNVDSENTHFVKGYETFKEALEKVCSLYAMDSQSKASKNQYYYFIKEI